MKSAQFGSWRKKTLLTYGHKKRVPWLTASNALDKSVVATAVLCGGFASLKPSAICVTRGRRAEVVESWIESRAAFHSTTARAFPSTSHARF